MCSVCVCVLCMGNIVVNVLIRPRHCYVRLQLYYALVFYIIQDILFLLELFIEKNVLLVV